jgi:hypothetical protein
MAVLSLLVFSFFSVIQFTENSFAADNNGPELSLGGVDPDWGNTSTHFTFFVTYSHPEGIVPDNVLLIIDDSSFVMKALGEDHTKGVLYEVTTKLNEGDHDYYFITAALGVTVRFPAGREMEVAVEDRDFMFLNGSGAYSEPEKGGQFYTFHTIYRDTRGLEPDLIQVRIDDFSYDMTGDGDDWSTGVNFTVTLELEPGDHRYYFFASNPGGSIQDPWDPGTFHWLFIEPEDPLVILDQGHDISENGICLFWMELNEGSADPVNVKLFLDRDIFHLNRTILPNRTRHEVRIPVSYGTHLFHYFLEWGWDERRYPFSGDMSFSMEKEDRAPEEGMPPNARAKINLMGSVATFDASLSTDPDGSIVGCIWEIDGVPYLGKNVTIRINNGFHYGKLTISDNDGYTDEYPFDFWVINGSILEDNGKVLGYFRVEDTLTAKRLSSSTDIEIRSHWTEDTNPKFILESEEFASGLVLIDLPCQFLSCLNNSRPVVFVDGSKIPEREISALLDPGGDTEMVAFLFKDGYLQIVLNLNLNKSTSLNLVPEAKEDTGINEEAENNPFIAVGLIFTIFLVLFFVAGLILIRARIADGPKNPHEDFIISRGGILTNGNGARRRKKVEWEAYLEE